MAKRIDLHRLFMSLQRQLRINLQVGRENLPHPVTKGDASELNWQEALERFLPQRYRVQRGTIVDSNGHISDSIDLVIYDRQYSPLIFQQGGALYIPAESVYAAIEVKQEFSKRTLEYAGEKIASVRKLHRTSVPIPAAGGRLRPKRPFEVIGGLLASRASWRPPFDVPFREQLFALSREHRLQLGCAIEHGSFDVVSFSKRTVEQSTKDTCLVFFFLRLFRRLQQLGTVPAIDLIEYGKNSGLQHPSVRSKQRHN